MTRVSIQRYTNIGPAINRIAAHSTLTSCTRQTTNVGSGVIVVNATVDRRSISRVVSTISSCTGYVATRVEPWRRCTLSVAVRIDEVSRWNIATLTIGVTDITVSVQVAVGVVRVANSTTTDSSGGNHRSNKADRLAVFVVGQELPVADWARRDDGTISSSVTQASAATRSGHDGPRSWNNLPIPSVVQVAVGTDDWNRATSSPGNRQHSAAGQPGGNFSEARFSWGHFSSLSVSVAVEDRSLVGWWRLVQAVATEDHATSATVCPVPVAVGTVVRVAVDPVVVVAVDSGLVYGTSGLSVGSVTVVNIAVTDTGVAVRSVTVIVVAVSRGNVAVTRVFVATSAITVNHTIIGTVSVVPVHLAVVVTTVTVDEAVIVTGPSTACIRNLRYTGSAEVDYLLEVVFVAVVVLPVVGGEVVVEAVDVVLDGSVGPPKHPLAVVVGLPDVGVGHGEFRPDILHSSFGGDVHDVDYTPDTLLPQVGQPLEGCPQDLTTNTRRVDLLVYERKICVPHIVK